MFRRVEVGPVEVGPVEVRRVAVAPPRVQKSAMSLRKCPPGKEILAIAA